VTEGLVRSWRARRDARRGKMHLDAEICLAKHVPATKEFDAHHRFLEHRQA